MFKPYVGAKWGDPDNLLAGTRLLVLGESHYCAEGETDKIGTCQPDVTEWVVKKYALQQRHRYFTGITQLVAGRKRDELSQQELESVWASLVFYNYVPVFVSDQPRVRPTSAHFAMGVEPLKQVIREYEPNAILVTGFELWNWVMHGQGKPWGSPSPQRIEGVIAARIKHPSTAFNWEDWLPQFRTLVDDSVRPEAGLDREV